MKLRPVPIIATILLSSLLLFGGWFVYENFMVKNPIEQAVEEIPGVVLSDIQLDRNSVNVTLQLSDEAKLSSVYEEVNNKSKSIAGNRSVWIDLQSESSELLDEWWSSALFSVAQAMETKQYSHIPTSLEALAGDIDGLKVSTEMDANYVYVHLSEGDHAKYIVLPRTPIEMGVWANESL